MNKKTVTNTTRQTEENPASFLVAAMSGGGSIEEMEAKGQREFVESDVFPVDIGQTPKDRYEELGFQFHGPVECDDLFQFVTLPDGWKREPFSDHDMWSNIVDADGVVRVQVFYKAAFYDRRAFARLTNEE